MTSTSNRHTIDSSLDTSQIAKLMLGYLTIPVHASRTPKQFSMQRVQNSVLLPERKS